MIGERIRLVREEKDIDQSVFASFLGVTKGRLYNIESGNNPPNLSQIVMICDRHLVDANWLLCVDKTQEEINNFHRIMKEHTE